VAKNHTKSARSALTSAPIPYSQMRLRIPQSLLSRHRQEPQPACRSASRSSICNEAAQTDAMRYGLTPALRPDTPMAFKEHHSNDDLTTSSPGRPRISLPMHQLRLFRGYLEPCRLFRLLGRDNNLVRFHLGEVERTRQSQSATSVPRSGTNARHDWYDEIFRDERFCVGQGPDQDEFFERLKIMPTPLADRRPSNRKRR